MAVIALSALSTANMSTVDSAKSRDEDAKSTRDVPVLTASKGVDANTFLAVATYDVDVAEMVPQSIVQDEVLGSIGSYPSKYGLPEVRQAIVANTGTFMKVPLVAQMKPTKTNARLTSALYTSRHLNC